MSNHSTSHNYENLHEHLTEDSIRHAALRFLKTYYKYRSRQGETTAGKNLTTTNGIVVDGYLSFKKEDGQDFLATLEASSWSKRGEVNFTTQNRILTWDALAFGSLVGLLLFSYGYAYNHFTVEQIGLLGCIGIILGTILTVFTIFRLLSRNISRYRYIYAVEQFKRYAADEQWIVIGEDVFQNPEDIRLKELKRQCVYSGFGLVSIDKDFEPHLIITPARKAVVKGRKKVFKVLSDNRISAIIKKTPLKKIFSKIKGLFGKVVQKSPINTGNLMRYQRKFWRQASVVFICLGLMGNIMYRELKDADIIHVDTKVYQEEMEKISKKSIPESEYYIVDTVAKHDPFYRKQENIYDQSANRIVEKNKNIAREYNIKNAIKSKEVAIWDGGQYIYYDCTRFFNFQGQKYLVVDNIFSNLSKAESRINSLSRLGISANAFWLGCFDKANGYIVYYDKIYNERSTAKLAADTYEQVFSKSTLPEGNMDIMVLER